MKTSVLQFILALIGLISLASLGAVVVFVSAPTSGAESASFLTPILISLSFFLFLGSTFTLLGFRARKRFINENNKEKIIWISFREGILAGLLFLIFVWLFHFEFFKFWTALPLLVIFIGFEYLMLARKKYTR